MLLVADIGGTNARFALCEPDREGLECVRTLQCADYPNAVDAIRHYLSDLSLTSPLAVCIAAAGPLIDGVLSVTNNHWLIDQNKVQSDLGINQVKLLNDFEAIAWSLPHLGEDSLDTIGQTSCRALPEDNFNIAVLGPGTGLGSGGMFARNGHRFPLVGEGGHIGFAPKSKVQIEILEILREKYDRVCAERLLSGSGIENIYWALNVLRGEPLGTLSASEIFASASDGGNAVAADATQLFYEILGQVAGDMALVLGARDGVYLGGGIVKRYPEMLHISGFRNAFESKGRHRSMMEKIPTRLIMHPEPGLLGASICINVMYGDQHIRES